MAPSPVKYKSVLEPLETLTFAAAHTRRVMLGMSVLNLPWYNPVLLARQLTTLDVLSGGRLLVGVGIGWSPDEYEAAGDVAAMRELGAAELLFDVQWSPGVETVDDIVMRMEQLWELSKAS